MTSPIKTIMTYETSDGQQFKTELEALCNNQLIEFKKWYADNTIWTSNEPVDDGDLITWLKRNKEQVLLVIGE